MRKEEVFIAHVIDAVLQLRDKFSAQLQNVSQNLNQFQRQVRHVAIDMRRVGKATEEMGKNFTTRISMPIIATGAIASKSAMDFKESIANIDTLLDDHSHLKSYEQQVLNVSRATGMSLKTVSEGMYTAVSSLGDSGKKTQEIFKTMANAAKAGGAEVNDSVALISAAMKGYGSVSNKTAKKISDLAFQTAKLGVTTFPEMAKSMQPLFPLSKSLNFSFEELFGSMATLTGVTGNTSEVSTQLKAVFSNLMKPTTDMQKLIKKYGFSNAQAMIKSKGLVGVMKILQKETGGNADKMGKLFSSTEAVTALTALTGQNFKDLVNKTNEMKKAAGSTDTALRKVSSTTKDKFNVAINNLRVSLTELGVILLPIVTKISDAIGKVFNKFNKLSKSQKKAIVKFALFAAAIGPVIFVIGKITTTLSTVSFKFVDLYRDIKNAGSIMKWLISPGHLVVLGLLAIVVVAALVITHWKQICEFTKKVKKALITLKNNALDKVKKAFEDVKKKVKKFKDVIKDAEPIIKKVAKVLGVIFGPALVKTGTKAVIAGAKITGHFIAAIIKTGTQAVLNGVKLTVSFIGAVIKTGIQATIAGAKITGHFIAAIIKTGAQAAKTAAIITGKLIIAIISYAAAGWKTVAAITAQTLAWLFQKGIVAAHTIVLIAHKVASITLTGVTKALTVAQWALNAAFTASPIGWLVLGIGLLVIAVIGLYNAWKKNWGGIQDKTKAVIDKIRGWWNDLKEFLKHPIQGTINLLKTGNVKGEAKGKNALGTKYWGGGLSVVGEHGPEIVEMDSGVKVHDAKDSKKLFGGNGQMHVTFTGDIHVREEADIDKIATALVRKIKIAQLNMA
ncbi:phage tail tape measure protein [Clostridium botulinum]|uniref:phage tail tape measure protein n=2 Tax=Clostridium botulinum TaxID=1491 RepID=UPI001E4E1439|nr:phage tail tape measure protein [Clostridium botulinum]